MNRFNYSIQYSRFHDGSEAHAESIADWIGTLIKPYLSIAPDARILDIGCGFGFALRALRNMGYQNATGLEVSPEQARICQRAGFNVEVIENSMKWLQDHPKSFDFVLLLDVLEHLPVNEQIDLMRAIYTALQPGCSVFLTVPNADAMLSSHWRYIDFTHCSSFTNHSLFFVLKNAGFETIWIDSNKGIGRFPRRLWLRSNWPAVRKWIIRWCWLQVFKAEVPWENIDDICFDLNLKALATKA